MHNEDFPAISSPGIEKKAFDVLNLSSNIHYLYKLNSSFQITYEYCSGPKPDDYLNIVSFTADSAAYSQESIHQHNDLFHNHAPHIHDYYEFLIVLEGSLTQQLEGNDHLYPAGSCCLINRSLHHKEIFHQEASVLFLGFSVDFILNLFDVRSAYFKDEEWIQNTLLYQFIFDDLKIPGQKAYLDFIPASRNPVSGKLLCKFAEQIMKNMLFPKFGASHMLKGLFCNLLQYISSPDQYHCSCVELSNNNDYLLFARIESLLEQNDGRITRSELSGRLNYSGDYLNRIVKKYTGMCLHDYGMQFCMKRAAYYLSHTDDSVSSIMTRLSFTNRTYFYKLFRTQYGMTPKEFRNRKCQQHHPH